MTGQEVVDLVRQEVNEPVAAFWTNAEFLTWINHVERDYVREIHGMDFIAEVQTFDGRPDYPLPANWISAKAAFFNEPNSDGTPNWHRLSPTNLEKISQERPNFLSTDAAVRGIPQQYFIWQKSLYVDPVPNTTGRSIKLFFKGKAVPLTALTQSINVDDSLSDALVAGVLMRAWRKEQEFDRANEQETRYVRMIGKGHSWVKRQSGDQRYKLDVHSAVPFGGVIRVPSINPF